MQGETEDKSITIRVNKNPQFREELASTLIQLSQGAITDTVKIDPVRGAIFTTAIKPSKEVMWQLVSAIDLLPPWLDAANSDIDIVKANILNEVVIEISESC